MKKRLLGLLFFLALTGQIVALGWSPQLAQAAVNFINSFGGSFTLGGGLSVNTAFLSPQSLSPWTPYPVNNVILQSTGTMNVLRNASFTSWAHYKFLTQDNAGANPYAIGIASFTGAISGTTLTASSVTGTIQSFARVTDAQNFTTNATTAVGNAVLHFASTTGIVAGMHATDLTAPRAIMGDRTVLSTTSTTVTLSAPVGYADNNYGTNGNTLVSPGVGSGDTIAFSSVTRGTYIVRQLTGSAGAAGTYQVNISQTSPATGTDTMQTAGGWSAEGIYIIPVGTAGSSSVTCTGVPQDGNFAPSSVQCTAGGTLTDLIIRFPIDFVDTSRINCPLYAGPALNCVSANLLIQPITFQIWLTYGESIASTPTMNSKISCPLTTGTCLDDWSKATTDLAPVSLPTCNLASTPVQCVYAYTWVPTGINGDMEIEFHMGALTNTQNVIIQGMELKQTPSATCNGTAPPCLQLTPGPLEIPEVVADMQHNARFAQLIGSGFEVGWNAGNQGAIETTIGFTISTTQFIASWPLPVSLRCDVWNTGQKATPTCPPPNVYFNGITDYTLTVAGPTAFTATALAVNKYGLNSIQILATSSGMTAGQPGYVTWGSGGVDMILIDSAIIGD